MIISLLSPPVVSPRVPPPAKVVVGALDTMESSFCKRVLYPGCGVGGSLDLFEGHVRGGSQERAGLREMGLSLLLRALEMVPWGGISL